MNKIKQFLSSLSFRTGVIILSLCIPCYIFSFAQMLLPISAVTKGILWTILFGMAKTFQYSGIAILGVEGWKKVKNYFTHYKTLRAYIELKIIPLYESYDLGHRKDHIINVIEEALHLATFYDVNHDMIYAAAAFHDIGLQFGREEHHVHSARIIREDKYLPKWFTDDEINIIADAAEDHRASLDHSPRTIYGKIIAEADRQLSETKVIRRAIQYELDNYPDLDMQFHWNRLYSHLKDKYAEGGYLKLWIPESKNAEALKKLRFLIDDKDRLYTLFQELYRTELKERSIK